MNIRNYRQPLCYGVIPQLFITSEDTEWLHRTLFSVMTEDVNLFGVDYRDVPLLV